MMPRYVLDTNIFIQSHAANYPLDVVPSFWKKIKELTISGHLVSIDKVKDELYGYDGNLKNWCIESLPDGFFCDCKSTIGNYARVVSWAQSQNNHYQQKAIDDFMTGKYADAWLISYAMANSMKIATYETSDPKRRNRIKIPDACKPFNVGCVNVVKMFRELEVTI